jgi:hypothetical protein
MQENILFKYKIFYLNFKKILNARKYFFKYKIFYLNLKKFKCKKIFYLNIKYFI